MGQHKPDGSSYPPDAVQLQRSPETSGQVGLTQAFYTYSMPPPNSFTAAGTARGDLAVQRMTFAYNANGNMTSSTGVDARTVTFDNPRPADQDRKGQAPPPSFGMRGTEADISKEPLPSKPLSEDSNTTSTDVREK